MTQLSKENRALLIDFLIRFIARHTRLLLSTDQKDVIIKHCGEFLEIYHADDSDAYKAFVRILSKCKRQPSKLSLYNYILSSNPEIYLWTRDQQNLLEHEQYSPFL